MSRLIVHRDGGVTLDEPEAGAGFVPYADRRKPGPGKSAESKPAESVDARPRVHRRSDSEERLPDHPHLR